LRRQNKSDRCGCRIYKKKTIGEVGVERWVIYLDYWGDRGDLAAVLRKGGQNCVFGVKVGRLALL